MKLAEILRALRPRLVPGTVLLGAVVGFGTLCVLGRQAAREDIFKGFVRFMEWTGPERKFYPTVGEMMSIVRTKAKPSQVLVIVGGNSILRGVGQTAEQVWTKALQENLGPGYAVVNMAFDSSGITDGAAVAAEALRKEYPKQIYIANAAPMQAPAPDGSGVYRFVFWEARAKGLLIDDPARNAAIVQSNSTARVKNPPPDEGEGLQELRAREYLDSLFYFQDFWNKFTYQELNTVWANYYAAIGGTSYLNARNTFKDPGPDGSKGSITDRYILANQEIEMTIVRGCSINAFGTWAPGQPFLHTKDPATGKWEPEPYGWRDFSAAIKSIMPDELKKRTLVLMSESSPFYLNMLEPAEQERDTLAYKHAVEMWKAGGYDAMVYGGMDYTSYDYNDRTHLTVLGGNKLAKSVADKVREMSQTLGYLAK